jgi:hypothetical protein
MIDFYKRLNLPGGATEQQIRSALGTAAPDLRRVAETILLDPRRRRVYDRNRELLLTIAQLRFDLGLNYTRFWSRRQFKDFWKMPTFPFASEAPEAPKRRVDKMMIAQAFHTARHHSRHHAARWGWLWAIGLLVLGAAGLLVVLWHASF